MRHLWGLLPFAITGYSVFPYSLMKYFSYSLGLIPFSSRACHTLVCTSGLVAVDVMALISTVSVSDFFFPHCVKYYLHFLAHFRQISKDLQLIWNKW